MVTGTGNPPANHIPTTGTRTESTISEACDGKQSISSRIDPFTDKQALFPVFYPASPTTHQLQVSTNRVNGTLVINGTESFSTAVVTLDLRRK